MNIRNSHFHFNPEDSWSCSWQDKYASRGNLEDCLDMVYNYLESDNRNINEVRHELLKNGNASGNWWSIWYDEDQFEEEEFDEDATTDDNNELEANTIWNYEDEDEFDENTNIENDSGEINSTNIINFFPDELNSEEIFQEGDVSKVLVSSYERNPNARQKCIDFYGANCVICNFNFGKVFGKLGDGVIHVHHLIPISQIGDKYQIDPIKDLRPICPNCHVMLHQRNPPFSIEEIKHLLKKNSIDSKTSDDLGISN